MKKTAKHIYNALRTAIVTLLVAGVTLFAALYIALSIPAVQNKLKQQGEKALSDYLKTNVTIDEVSFMPFNELLLHNVSIPDQQGDSLINIDKLGAGISLYNLIAHRQLVFTYGEIIGLHGRITKPDKDSPTNLQFIIDAFKPKDNKPPKPFDVKVFNVVLRKCDISYDLLDAPRKANQFDPNHLHITDVKADVTLPRLKNNDFIIDLKRLSLKEQSGFVLKDLATTVTINDNKTTATGIRIELPNSMLSLGDIELNYASLKTMGNDIKQANHELTITNSYVNLKDLGAFVPKLKDYDQVINFTAVARGNAKNINIPTLSLQTDNEQVMLNAAGQIYNLDSVANLSFNVPHILLHARAEEIERVISHFANLSPQVRGIISRCGNISIDGSVAGNKSKLDFDGGIATSLGTLNIDGIFNNNGAGQNFAGHLMTKQFKVGELLAQTKVLGDVALNVDADASIGGGKLASASIDGFIDYIDLNGNRYHNITANFKNNHNNVNGTLAINDAAGVINLNGDATLAGVESAFDVKANINNVNLARLGIKNVPNGIVSFDLDANFTGNSPSNVTGDIELKNVDYSDAQQRKVHLDQILLIANNNQYPQNITLSSDFVNGKITGSYDFTTLVPSIKGMLSTAFPGFFGKYAAVQNRTGKKNDLDFNFTIDNLDALNSVVKLPVKPIYKTTLNGYINESNNSFELNVNAPYLLNGKNIIEGSDIQAKLDSKTGNVTMLAHTLMPSKKGKIAITLNASGINDRLDTNLGWRVMRDHDFHGDINLSALLMRNDDGSINATVDVNPTQLVFNDKPWQVNPAKVSYNNGVINIDHMSGFSDEQYIKINGEISKDPSSEVCLELNDISLDYVFETLNINHVSFGGQATGKFYASDVFTKAPRIYTPVLHVDGLSYNNALMGDADIKSRWLNDEKAVELNADLAQDNGRHSLINGAIFVADDSLHLTFDADHANPSFLKPYMQAFTSDVSGAVSGRAVLFGNFKTINLYGDIKADSLRFKLDYTNVYYTCKGDSVHMKPDLITFDDVRIHDRDGHEAKMSGWLRHESFHRPVFNFSITNARNLLCYDTNADINPVWYGQIYGNGSAFVTGEPGRVDIKVNMQSAPNSKFTFVLSDSEEANEYNFITFRDRNKPAIPLDTVVEIDTIPDIVKQLTAKAQTQEESIPTEYTIDLQGDITPDAQLILIMDPVGGDQIKATGRGNMRLTYNNNDEMTMFGKYTLEKGNYNFTLQDIIIKDFTIRNGSSISFQGDPYAAMLDIEAVYSLNANIKDLDESFANDKEINRTNVPVHAILKAKGIMSQPDISFDLEFPTLTTDAYRKIKSIISTDDMMNRQIIYLLALNRFYTPEYMGNTKNNNELTSIASSTISSQLSNILGKMSDNWSISPNFRTDRGDFSDMEVDLALSSQLLNNRLLFNGNFGYRDNTYNTRNSNFIGDFDIEYLLNSNGSLRLKAYNHFNDQNYYVRNALTTQGVGLVWKHDFERPFDFLRKKKLNLNLSNDSTVTDTTRNVANTQQ